MDNLDILITAKDKDVLFGFMHLSIVESWCEHSVQHSRVLGKLQKKVKGRVHPGYKVKPLRGVPSNYPTNFSLKLPRTQMKITRMTKSENNCGPFTRMYYTETRADTQ